VILIVTMANHRYTHKSLEEEEPDLELRVISYSELFKNEDKYEFDGIILSWVRSLEDGLSY